MRRVLMFICLVTLSPDLFSQHEIKELIAHYERAMNYGYRVNTKDCAGNLSSSYEYFVGENGRVAVQMGMQVYLNNNQHYLEIDNEAKTMVLASSKADFFTPPKIESSVLESAKKDLNCSGELCTLNLDFQKPENVRVSIVFNPKTKALYSYKTTELIRSNDGELSEGGQCVELEFKPLKNQSLSKLDINDLVKTRASVYQPAETYSNYEFFNYTQR